jgi:hypothetical protein
MHQAAELEMDMHSTYIHVPNTPITGSLTRCRLLFFSNPILSRYYNLIHPSPLACILLLRENFLFGIALSCRGGNSQCLLVPDRQPRVNSGWPLAHRHTWHTNTIGPNPASGYSVMVITEAAKD